MNTQNTIEKMKQLKLFGMSEIYHQSLSEKLFKEYTTDEFLALLVDTEWDRRENKKIDNLHKSAGFKFPAQATNIDYSTNRNLDKNMFERILTLQFIQQSENLIITGPSGIGKSYLAQAIGQCAVKKLFKTIYYNTGKLNEEIKLHKIQGNYLKLLKKIQNCDLLIIEDFGLHSMDNHYRQAFFDIVEERHERKSTIVTSQFPVKAWHEIIGESTIADAILDRLVFCSHRIELTGESMRKKKKLKG
jgi:DNA replication protein DnaC